MLTDPTYGQWAAGLAEAIHRQDGQRTAAQALWQHLRLVTRPEQATPGAVTQDSSPEDPA